MDEEKPSEIRGLLLERCTQSSAGKGGKEERE
jgi:hypothetical protein